MAELIAGHVEAAFKVALVDACVTEWRISAPF